MTITRTRTCLFLGDSLAAGYYATTLDDGFQARIAAALGVTPVGASKAGGTVKAGSVKTLPENVDVAVVELGTNDSLHTLPWVFARQYGDLVSRIRAASPDARLVCVGVWRSWWRAWMYDAAIRTVARKHGGVFVPLSDVYRMSDSRGPAGRPTAKGTSDGFHPNDTGHARIADRILTAL